MSKLTLVKPSATLEQILFTRCPVPTATGLAYKLGWLTDEFAADGIPVATLQEGSNAALGRHHYDHQHPALIREGGNILAIAARAQGAPSRLVGLTWIEERQAILVRAGTGVTEAKHLKGLRLAVPAWSNHAIADHARGSSIARGMSLHGYKGALASAGLSFDDVRLVPLESAREPVRDLAGAGRDTPNAEAGRNNLEGLWPFRALADGIVDAIYVKGASALDHAKTFGLEVGVDLDQLPERRFRVNNGTPRPITVHESLIDDHFDLLVRFLERTLAAADWARGNLQGVHDILQSETRGSRDAVVDAYRDGFHETLHPDLSDERLALFEQQKQFLHLYGFLERDFDLEPWIDRRPLQAALALRAERAKAEAAA